MKEVDESLEAVKISALEHWSYCPRQCGLIHVESVWDENVFTLKGSQLHERADQPTSRSEKGKIIERALPIWSEKYGLVGRADVVEFDMMAPGGMVIVPVEYKSGKPKRKIHASIQLAAQALCLEEMFDCTVRQGALFFYATNERIVIEIDDALRCQTLDAIEKVRAMMVGGVLPAPADDDRCPKCSLVDACMPTVVTRAARVEVQSLFVPRAPCEVLP